MTDQSDIGGPAGIAILQRIGGTQWTAGIAPLAQVSPDMARLTVDFAYGDVLGRSGADLLTRQCCTIAMLLVDGSAAAQLKFHLHGLFNVGGTVVHAAELLGLSTAMAGFPAAIGSIGVLREVLRERGMTWPPAAPDALADREAAGLEAVRRVLGDALTREHADAAAFAPRFARLSQVFEFGDVVGASTLDEPTLRLTLIAMLGAMGGRDADLRAHLSAALDAGLDPDLIREILIQLSVYAGFPAALNAFSALAAGAERPSTRRHEQQSANPATPADRRRLGLSTLAATSGETGEAIVHGFDDVAPRIGAMIVDHAYGEIFSNSDLDAKTRELCAIATIAGHMSDVDTGPLDVHIAAARRLGATRKEITEVIVNVAPYRGYPTARRALTVAAKAWQEIG